MNARSMWIDELSDRNYQESTFQEMVTYAFGCELILLQYIFFLDSD